ncbi:hypothetical protein P7K49_011928 [Saguinus oedipus]|uniref:Uncharacterized protein n=1 Tax=Saguinus oedipus TaxID=9490 RepID=A0ABQ9VS14_SAGOE|nr:hypothetical protein P7K49_011928 [Saguinus oedipus]
MKPASTGNPSITSSPYLRDLYLRNPRPENLPASARACVTEVESVSLDASMDTVQKLHTISSERITVLEIKPEIDEMVLHGHAFSGSVPGVLSWGQDAARPKGEP